LTQIGFLGIHATAAVVTNSMATVLVVAAVVVLYLWVASFYEFAAFNLTLLFLWIAFGLMGIAMYSGVEALTVVGGISAVISGLIGAYASFAAIYNATCLQDVVPLGESAKFENVPRTMRWSAFDASIQTAGCTNRLVFTLEPRFLSRATKNESAVALTRSGAVY